MQRIPLFFLGALQWTHDVLIYAITWLGESLDSRVIVSPKEAGVLLVWPNGQMGAFPGLECPGSETVQSRLMLMTWLYTPGGRSALDMVRAELARLAAEASAKAAGAEAMPENINQP